MALKDRWIPIKFQFGVETEQDDKTLVPGQLTSLENGVFDRRVTIQKRAGTERLPRTRVGVTYSAVSGTIGLVSRDDGEDLVMLASTDEVLPYATVDEGWIRGGDWVHVRNTVTSLPRRPFESWDPTTASTGSVHIVAWEDARGGVYAQLFSDRDTAYGPEFRIGGSGGTRARALAVGGRFHVYFASGSTLNVGVINAADPTSTDVTITQLHSSLWSLAPYYDVAPVGNAANSSLIAISQSGSIYVGIVRPNGALGTTSTTPAYPNPISGSNGTAIPLAVSISDDGQQGLIAYKTFAPLSGVQAWHFDVSSLPTPTGPVAASASFPGKVIFEDRSMGPEGNARSLMIVDGGPFVAASLNESNPLNISVTINISAGDLITDTTWAEFQTLVNTSAYIRVRTLTAAGTMTVADIGSTSFAGGSNGSFITMDANPLTNGYGTVNRLAAGFLTASDGVYEFQVIAEVSASDAANRYLRRSVAYTTASLAHTSGTLIRHSSLASHQFTMGTRPFVWTTHVSPLQSTDFLVRADDGLTVGRSRPGQAMTDVSGILGNVDVRGSSFYRAVTNREQLVLPNTPISASAFADRDLKLISTEYHPSSSWRPVDIDGVLHMPGGWLGIFDGVSVSEHGFGLKSEGANLAPYGSAGNIGAGSFLWAAVPEAYDARGSRHLGGFVQFLTASFTGSTNSGTLDIRTIAHTMRDGVRAPDLRFVIYRTGPNGTVLQRVGTVTNQTGSDTVRFVDNVSETARSVGELIYASEGGGPEKMNSMPPSLSTLALAGDRLFLAGLETDPYAISCSKLRLGGAVAFADDDEMSVEARGGPITNLSALDDKLVAFKRDRVYAVSAEGPDNDASDTRSFQVPSLVTSDVGAPEPATVAEVAGTTVQGLVFRSGRGFRLLDRNLQMADIGGPVRGYDSLTVVGAVAPSSHDEVRFYTTEGRTLVLNTRFNQWSTFPAQPAVAATDWNGRPTYSWANGSVWAEDTGSYLDGGTPYPMQIELAWLPLQGIQGLSRVRQLQIIGDYYTPHTLRVEMAFDYRDSWRKVREIDVTASLGVTPYGGGVSGSSAIRFGTGSYGGSDPVYQFRVDMPVQRMESLRLRLSDTEPEGRSFNLTELKLRVATESEKARMPTRKIR